MESMMLLMSERSFSKLLFLWLDWLKVSINFSSFSSFLSSFYPEGFSDILCKLFGGVLSNFNSLFLFINVSKHMVKFSNEELSASFVGVIELSWLFFRVLVTQDVKFEISSAVFSKQWLVILCPNSFSQSLFIWVSWLICHFSSLYSTYFFDDIISDLIYFLLFLLYLKSIRETSIYSSFSSASSLSSSCSSSSLMLD